jgi:hypothetical protein
MPLSSYRGCAKMEVNNLRVLPSRLRIKKDIPLSSIKPRDKIIGLL